MPNRNEKGRFVIGNKAGKGRPPKEYAATFASVITPEIWEGIIRRAAADALKGEHDARAWLADRLIGRVPNILELRSADAVLLAELLKRFEAVGMSAGEVFGAMLAQIAEESETVHDER